MTILDPRVIPCCAPSLVESGNWSSFSNWFKNDEDLNLDFLEFWDFGPWDDVDLEFLDLNFLDVGFLYFGILDLGNIAHCADDLQKIYVQFFGESGHEPKFDVSFDFGFWILGVGS